MSAGLPNARFVEYCDIVSAIVPVDLQTAANNGDWVKVTDYDRVVAVLFKGAGTASDDPVFKMQQATDNAAGGIKDLTFTTIYHKIGTLTSVGQWTKVTQDAATSYTNTVSAESQAIMLVEFKASDLDSANGFDHLRLDIADVGTNAQLGCAFYICVGNKHAQATPLSSL